MLCQPNVSKLVFPTIYKLWGVDIIILILLIWKLGLKELKSTDQVETVNCGAEIQPQIWLLDFLKYYQEMILSWSLPGIQ